MKACRSSCWAISLPILTCIFVCAPNLKAQTFVGTNQPGASTNYSFTMGAGATNLSLVVSNSTTAFSHLWLKKGGAAATNDFDFVARLDQKTNSINLELPEFAAPLNYGLLVTTPAGSAAHEFSVALTTNRADLRSAAYPALKPLVFTTTGTLTNGATPPGNWHYFQVDVPTNLPGWRVVLSATGVGNPDLYVRRGALPTQSSFDKGSVNQLLDTVVFSDTEATAGTYFIGVFLPNTAPGNTSYTLTTELGYLTALAWDPGTTHAGTQVFTNQSPVGGDYFFKITTQNTSVGAWRTALNVISGEADVYLRQGTFSADPNSYPTRSPRVGSDGFVLHSSEFQASQDWFIVVRSSVGAQWTLVTGEAFVQDLGSLATDASSGSGSVPIGAEGYRFFKTSVPANTAAWQLWLNGQNNLLQLKKAAVPMPQSYELQQNGQMLVVPPYLANGTYFISVAGSPGTILNLDSRQHVITDLGFGTSTNVIVTGFPYRTYRVQVPVQQIAWQIDATPLTGDPNVAVRQNLVPNEFNNDALSEVAGTVTDSITLVPPTLSDGTFYITVYGAGAFNVSLQNGNPVITDINYVDTIANDTPTKVGWRFYRVANLQQQLGTLGWDLFLTSQPANTELALRRNAVPGRWNYRTSGAGPYVNGYVDYSGPAGFIQRPGHQADIWYIGVYNPGTALGSFVLNTRVLSATTIPFDGAGNSANVVNQPAGKWQYYRVDVPADALGWNFRLRNVTSGDPQMSVRRDLLPAALGNIGYVYPFAGTTFPSGYQVGNYTDWTGYSYDSNGSNEVGHLTVMGMNSPLQPGTYYVGIINNSGTAAMNYTFESRGIGASYAIPVTPLNFSGAGNSVSASGLPLREAHYYAVTIPANTPSWKLKLTPTAGETLLLVQKDSVPGIGTGGYLNPGARMQKTGNEHYVMFPNAGQTNLAAGTYYIAVVGEGVAPNPAQSRSGTGTSSYTLTSLGVAPISNLGTLAPVGGADLVVNSSIEGGETIVYQFTVPANTRSMELRLTPTAGNPGAAVRASGTNFPSSFQVDNYGATGGETPEALFSDITTVANPTPGIYTVVAKARFDYNAQGYPNASYSLSVRATEPGPVLFDTGATNIVSQAPNTWRYFRVDVPAGSLGWHLRLQNVTGGQPQMVVRRDLLPTSLYTTGFFFPYQYTTWPSGFQLGVSDWNFASLDFSGTNVDGRRLILGMSNPLEPGTYYVGVINPSSSDTNSMTYTLDSRGIGSGYAIPVPSLNFSGAGSTTNVTGLPPREGSYFQFTIPASTPSWKLKMTPTVGEALLLVRKDIVPSSAEGQSGSTGFRMQKATNEHFVLLPPNGQSNLAAGTYYVAVVSEGQNPAYGRTGSNTCNFTLTSIGALPILNLGNVGAVELMQADTLEGGEAKAYQFNVPANTLSVEVELVASLGSPGGVLRTNDQLPALPDYYGKGGGQPAQFSFDDLATIPNPTPGVHTLIVQARNTAQGYLNAAYTVRVRAVGLTPLAFDGGTASVVNQTANTWRYFQVDVPAGAFGWDVRLINVTAGDPRLSVRRAVLPDSLNTHSDTGSFWYPGSARTWPAGYQWGAGADWTGYYNAPDGSNEYGRVLAMGAGNPLEPGTYIVGVINSGGISNMTYTVQSRGIGTNFAVAVTTLNFSGAGSSATMNGLAPREAAYFAVQVPANTPSWKVRMAPTAGDALLVVQKDALPNVTAYANQSVTSFSGGAKMQKAGNEHFLLLPPSGQSNIAAGMYYLGVVSEGVNPGSISGRIGTNSSSFTIESQGSIAVDNLGTVGADLLRTNAVEGGEARAYQFTVPPGVPSIEVRLENRAGNPVLTLISTNLLPNFYYAAYYGNDGGQSSGSLSDPNLITVANPTPGVYSLIVQGGQASGYPDASYVLRVRQPVPPELNFTASLNTNGMTNVMSGVLADRQRSFFKVVVPSTNGNDSAVLAWRLNLAVSQGSAQVRVRKDLLPVDGFNTGTTGFVYDQAIIAPTFLTPGTWYVEVYASGATTFTLTSSSLALVRPAWVMPQAGQAPTTPGVAAPFFGDTGINTSGVALPGDGGTDLEQNGFDYYAITVPTNNVGLVRVELQAISGNPDLYARVGTVPTLTHSQPASGDRQMTGTGTEYANWVTFDGKTESTLTPGTWYFAVKASGNSNVRYRIKVSTGDIQDLALSGGALANQILAAGDWRYYRVQVPLNAPTNWNVTFSQQGGDVVMYLRDTSPPGQGSYSGDIRDWGSDRKNQPNNFNVSFPSYDPPGTYTNTVPSLRPGHVYYIGFKAVNDATFSVSSAVSAGTIQAAVIPFYGGTVSNTLAAAEVLRYRIDVPADAWTFQFTSTAPTSVKLFIEQGSLPVMTGYDTYTSFGANSTYQRSFINSGGWPWVTNQSYFLTVSNSGAGGQPFVFVMDGRNMLTADDDNDGLPDYWEIQFFGSIYSYGPGSDPDGDGVNNLSEFLEGTDPSNRLSLRPRLTVNAVNGTVNVNPLSTNYAVGTQVTLTATPNGGFDFAGWTGNVVTGVNPLVLTLTSNVNVTANFVLPPPPNDNFANAIVLSGSVINTNGTNANATKEAGEPNHANNAGGKSVWWMWTAPATGTATISTIGSLFDTTLGVYTGSAVNALTLVAQDDDAGGNNTSRVTFPATSGTVYRIAVDGYGGASGNITLNISLVSPPANDNFANRIVLNGTGVVATGNNANATKETGEPNHAGNVGGRSVWWSWTAPANGTVTNSTIGSAFDTLLGVYTGAAVNALTLVASDNDSGGGSTSRAVFPVTGGVTYQIAVDGSGGASGNITLNLDFTPAVPPPANDNFANRIVLAGATVTTTGTNNGATKEAGEPNHNGNPGGKSVWWSWTAPSSGVWTISTIGSSFDTVLGVYTGTAVNSLVVVASDDEAGGNFTSRCVFNAVAGTTYQIAVDGFGGAQGNITLNISPGGPIAEIERPHMGAPGAPFFVEVFVLYGGNYRLQFSTNLTTWTTLSTNLNVPGSFFFQDNGATNSTFRFYRVISP